jgi:hypothetical protein
MKTLTLTLDTAAEKALRQMAASQGGRSISSLVREAVHALLLTSQADAPAGSICCGKGGK